jgi:hypothetical protein
MMRTFGANEPESFLECSRSRNIREDRGRIIWEM